MNKYFVFNNLCGIADGTAIFPSTMRGDQKAPSPTKMCRIFRYLRRCGDAQWFFQKHAKYDMILSIKRLFLVSLFFGFRKISSVLLTVLSCESSASVYCCRLPIALDLFSGAEFNFPLRLSNQAKSHRLRNL